MQADEGALILFFITILLIHALSQSLLQGQCKINLKCIPPPAIAPLNSENFLLCRNLREWRGRVEKEPRRPTFFFLSLLQNCTIHNVDNVKSSHLIKLVHAVQSLKKKKNALMSRRESGQIIKYKLISVLNPRTEQ